MPLDKPIYFVKHTLLKLGLNVKEHIPQHSVLNEKNGLLFTISIILKYPSNPLRATQSPLSILYSAWLRCSRGLKGTISTSFNVSVSNLYKYCGFTFVYINWKLVNSPWFRKWNWKLLSIINYFRIFGFTWHIRITT